MKIGNIQREFTISVELSAQEVQIIERALRYVSAPLDGQDAAVERRLLDQFMVALRDNNVPQLPRGA